MIAKFIKHTHKNHLWISLMLALLLSTLLSFPAQGQLVEVEFGETVIEPRFTETVRFTVKIDRGDSRGDIEFWYKMGAMNWEEGEPNCRGITVNNVVDYFNCTFLLKTDDLPPQMPIIYKWEVADPYGTALVISEEKTYVYTDPAYTWESRSTENLTVWWHDHPAEFGESAVNLAETALQNQSKLYGIELLYPVQIVIENSQAEFNEWNDDFPSLGSELVYYRLGMTVQIIGPEQEAKWKDYFLSEFISRGISHLYFFEASGRKHKDPPTWLENGLGQYNVFHSREMEWNLVRDAARQDKLIPLSELRENFDGDDARVYLSYAESMTAIEYIISAYGEEGLHALFENYRNYKTSDEAFEAAFGKNMAEVEADWEVWVKSHPKVTSLSDKVKPYLSSILIVTVVCSLMVFILILGVVIYFSRRQNKSV